MLYCVADLYVVCKHPQLQDHGEMPNTNVQLVQLDESTINFEVILFTDPQ